MAWVILGGMFFPFVIIVSAIILKREAFDRLTNEYTSQGYSKEEAQEMAKSRRR